MSTSPLISLISFENEFVCMLLHQQEEEQRRRHEIQATGEFPWKAIIADAKSVFRLVI